MNASSTLIFLIGFMGSGKTFYGKKIAHKLNYAWLDLDIEIERESQMTIDSIFNFWGENKFREIERDCLHKTFKETNTLVSCGGGTPCFFDNLEQMQAKGKVVYIQASNEIILGRLRQKKDKRPMINKLNNEELKMFIETKMKERETIYNSADFVFNGDAEKIEDLIKEILK